MSELIAFSKLEANLRESVTSSRLFSPLLSSEPAVTSFQIRSKPCSTPSSTAPKNFWTARSPAAR
jgi:hypothetical protein